MKNPFYSVIIPVYNVEEYLDQCIKSVLNQTFVDYEVILVDDGSTDSCSKMCDEYEKKYSKVKTIHKKNGGLSSARNEGIKKSKGNYILFLDSDDYWETQNDLLNLHLIIEKSNDADIIVFASKHLYPDGKIFNDSRKWNNHYYASCIDTIEELIRKGHIIGSACTNAIKRNFLINNNLYFVEGLKSEDIEWVFRVSSLLPSYYYYDSHFYIYRQKRKGSITNTIDLAHIKQYLSIIRNYCNNNRVDLAVKTVFYNHVSYQYSLLCANVNNIKNKKDRKHMIGEVKELSWLFNYDLMPRMRKINLFYSIFGFRITILVLGLYMKLRV